MHKTNLTSPNSVAKIQVYMLNKTQNSNYFSFLRNSGSYKNMFNFMAIVYLDSEAKSGLITKKPNYSDRFKKIVKRYIRVGYNLDVMRQSACLVLSPITVYSYGFLLNCTTVGQVSDSMTALT